MKEIVKLGVVLALFCFIAAALLGFTNEMTKDKILEQRAIENEKAMMAVLPEAKTFEALSDEELEAMKNEIKTLAACSIGLSQSGEVVGYVFKTLPGGYGGVVEVITGIGTDQTVKGVRVGNHQETPGLGAKAKEAPYYSQYENMDASKAMAYTDVDAISGATITSDAVTDGVNVAIEAYAKVGGEQ